MQKVFLERSLSQNRQRFLALLFEPGQASCFTRSEYGWRVSLAPKYDDLFFSINALHGQLDLAPVKDWHKEHQPRRADANVICHRNFLLELDDVPLDEQVDYVTNLVPVSSIVYSGGKSYHFIISLTEAVTAEKYKELAKRLHSLVTKADPQCKNPSRLSRLPDVTRPETGKAQALIELRNRIPLAELEAVLPTLEKKKKSRNLANVDYVPQLLLEACIFPDDIMERFNLQGRNLFFFWLYNRMNEADVSDDLRERYVETAYENLRDVSDFSLEEARSAARISQ